LTKKKILQKLDYARTKSDAVAKLDGSWRKDKRTRKVRIGEIEGASLMETDEGDTMKKTKKQTALPSDLGEPNKTLFAEDLPEATNANMLGVLFRQFPGFVEARMVPGKPGISFIEFESDQQAGVALNGLQGFKITPQNQIKLSYAKK
jgi:U2 small nuclear ribonucleoprotein B''